MRIVKRVLSTYSADNFGVCSALYELGGLVVMHDASGCNSTYNTHDEPRWYDMDSLVFISGLTEKNAIFGNDDRLIEDLVLAAREFHPHFIAVCGGPLPHIIGTDFRAVAKAVERKTGIPTFGFQTNGMDSYISGAGQALEALVGLMPMPARQKGSLCKVNILGATPLDFSLNGSVEELKKLLKREGFRIGSTWAMGDSLEKILQSSDASVNLVISAAGYRAALAMEERFGIPFVTGLPAGKGVTDRILHELRGKTAPDRQDTSYGFTGRNPDEGRHADDDVPGILIIGEPICSLSIRETLETVCGKKNVRIISPMHGLPKEIIGLGCEKIEREDELREACMAADLVIADPLYARLLPDEQEKFIPLPHVAYSGRYYEKEIPVLIGEKLDFWLEKALSGRIPGCS